MKRPALYVSVAGVLLALSACGGSSETQTVTQVTVVKEAAPAAENAEVATTAAAAADPVEDDADETVVEEAAEEETSGGDITVPDVVGENHQAAQDLMQEKGLYMLDEEDSTGRGRALLWDRNWVVTSQSPEAGTKVDENETILLRSKKYTD